MKLSELHYLQLLDETRQEAIRPNKANFYHYFKEIERRLEEGERAKEVIEKLYSCKYEADKMQLIYEAWNHRQKILELG